MYILGIYRDLPLHINAMMRWYDNRILIQKGEEIIETILIEDEKGILI